MDDTYRKALARFASGDYAGAETEALVLCPDYRGTFLVAKCKFLLEDSGARDLFEKCAGVHCPNAYYYLGMLAPSDPEVYFKLGAQLRDCASSYKYGIFLYHKQKPKAALRCLQRACARPNDFRGDAFYAAGAIFLKARQHLKAVSYLRCASAEKCEAADDLLLQMSVLGENSVEAATGTGAYDSAVTLFHEGEKDKALTVLKNVAGTKRAPSEKRALALYTMGLIRLSLQQYDAGVKSVQEAAEAKFEKAGAFLAKLEAFV